MQLRYEIYNQPDSCISRLSQLWYNSLYSELGDTSSFDCYEALDCTDFCLANFASILSLVPLISNQALFLNYFVTQLLTEDRRVRIQFLGQFTREVRRLI